jgi:predicted phage-related endonuclease
MKTPKGFNKMTIQEQESWLVKEFQKVSELQHDISRMLAKIRGGNKIIVKEIERPDELLLKS